MRRFSIPFWLKLFLFAMTILIPTVLVLGASLNKSMNFLAALSINSEIENALQTNIENMSLLKEYLPEDKLEELEIDFHKNLSVFQAYSELKHLKIELLNELQLHALIVGAIALLLSLFFAFLLARNVLGIFNRYAKKLLEKEHQQVLVNSLENWQNVSQSVIHEIKSSLTPLKLMSSRRDVSEQESAMNFIIVNEVRKMEVLIDELTNFARLPLPVLSHTDLNTTLDYFVQNSVIEGLTVQMNLEALQKQTYEVPHDPAMVQRLLYNLMRNSKEANPEQSDLTISLSVTVESDAVEVHFQDNGKGIPAHKLNAIFESRYSQKPVAETKGLARLPTNMGLGLTISKKIALDHNGDLYGLPSETGAHFVLKLPLKNANETHNNEFKYV